MKYLLLSDIHGNLAALKAVLAAEVEPLQILNLGDVCGYYPDVNECITLLREKNAISILGNHDQGVIEGRVQSKENDYRWNLARERLSRKNLRWLQDLGASKSMVIDGTNYYLHHGSPSKIDEYVYPDSNFSTNQFLNGVTLLGHTHIQMVVNHRNFVIINPGSVGQPRNGRPGADYAVLDSLENKVTFKHLDYKHESILQNSVGLISENSVNLLGRCDEDRFKKNPCGLGEFYFQVRI